MQLWTVLKGIPLLGVMHDDGENRFSPRRPNRLNPFEIMLVGYRYDRRPLQSYILNFTYDLAFSTPNYRI